ncbi:VC2046/SO_2500 family protein [Alteromonas sp. C1M14]|uniref:VC2046/SO_2500 family protein n=1 Tax=Alteromonas sp. C1M14 TaxID=2841567 RepID=UPI001C081689|nr:VC2046/SO_2500 family protein [Alteromonas sp. C1M14]MBU2976931.1 hypothetical protein [Alteromonas sp. C1M14]
MTDDLLNPSTAAPASPKLTDFEWSGRLSQATPSRALFSLYLAMHCQPGNTAIRIEDPSHSASVDDDFLARLNHYPKASLSPNKSDLEALRVSAKLAQNGQVSDLALWHTMHPAPLSAYNDPHYLSDDIKTNCSYATQQKLKSSCDNEAVLNADPTQLDDLIARASAFITA